MTESTNSETTESTTEKEVVKRTRKPKQPDPLLERIVNLENAISKFATLSGNGNHLEEFGLKRWNPEKKDMNKYG